VSADGRAEQLWIQALLILDHGAIIFSKRRFSATS